MQKDKQDLKIKAINLRREGKTYSEILVDVPVAKSTLSLWLRETKLSKLQNQKLSAKKRSAQLRGGEAQRAKRIAKTKEIYQKAIKQVGTLSKRELFLIGVALYWGEGSKERSRKGQALIFGNSDPNMIKFYKRFLTESLGISADRLVYSIYIHEERKRCIQEDIAFWGHILNIDDFRPQFIYYKKHSIKTNRTNIGKQYHGTLRIVVRKSSSILRMISGTIYGINGADCPIV
ncbi:MAG: hypothetical protein MUF19_03630 [Candidatus Pacebacteria bacterium]|nr:hypothetical protein [Candidatus Paceibacterota bacterium]